MSKFDRYKRTPLHYICIDIDSKERPKAAKQLMANGLDVNSQDNSGWSPPHFAAQEGDEHITQLLIEAGANLNLRDENGNSALWVATMNAQSLNESIKILLKKGADPTEKNKHDVSPVDIAPEFFYDGI